MVDQGGNLLRPKRFAAHFDGRDQVMDAAFNFSWIQRANFLLKPRVGAMETQKIGTRFTRTER